MADGRIRVGSVTKTFVATVLLQLSAEGRVGLDDPIGKYLPGVVPNGDAITVREVLNHTSGIVDCTEDPRFDLTTEDDPVPAVRDPRRHPGGDGPGAGDLLRRTQRRHQHRHCGEVAAPRRVRTHSRGPGARLTARRPRRSARAAGRRARCAGRTP
ncbi:serine hydrolase domain-containing protein [Kitasatospora sp. NBC_01266]|uniref:serine hydrolase domain-containing protein n=1 Tax=Kitasatospora sp. NBC_01266 TaxID=2903572 RepID=UPI003FA5F672